MKRSEPKKYEAVRTETDSYFSEKTSVDEYLDVEDTALTNPASSLYYPADLEDDFNPENYIKKL